MYLFSFTSRICTFKYSHLKEPPVKRQEITSQRRGTFFSANEMCHLAKSIPCHHDHIKSLDGVKLTMKSMDTLSHIPLGINNGYNNPILFFTKCLILLASQTSLHGFHHIFFQIKPINRFFLRILWCTLHKCTINTPSDSLKYSNVNPKLKTTEEQRVGVCSLTCSTFEVRGCWSSMMGTKTSDKQVNYSNCHDFSLGLTTKTRAWKGASQKCNPWITFTLPRMWENVRKWAHTFQSGLPLWELESLWGPYRVSNPHKTILRFKIHCIKKFIIPLERY